MQENIDRFLSGKASAETDFNGNGRNGPFMVESSSHETHRKTPYGHVSKNTSEGRSHRLHTEPAACTAVKLST